MHPGAGDLAESEVLHDDNPVVHVEGLGHHERLVGVFRRGRALAPGVAPRPRHPVLSKPPGPFAARTPPPPRRSLVVRGPPPPPAPVEEHRVAGPHVEPGPGKRLLGVSHRDDITWAELFGTP